MILFGLFLFSSICLGKNSDSGNVEVQSLIITDIRTKGQTPIATTTCRSLEAAVLLTAF